MLICLAILAANPLAFHETPLPGVEVGPVTPFTGRPVTNYLQSDLNGDRVPEIILPHVVFVQKDGDFPENQRVPVSETTAAGEADTFGSALYVRTADHLYEYAWSASGWRETLSQPLKWPGKQGNGTGNDGEVSHFRRFAYDIDGDQSAELIDLDAEGLHIYRKHQGQFVHAGLLRVLPDVTPAPATPQPIWPAARRRIVLPEQALSCRLVLETGALGLTTHRDTPAGIVFRHTALQLKRGADGQFTITGETESDSAGVPPHVRPCRLNGDDVLDYAGGRWRLSETTPVPLPLYETWASLDGGATFHIERARSFQHGRPHASFVDFDADGDLDMVTESTGIFEGGIRETANRFLMERMVEHRITIHGQENEAFSDGPQAVFTVQIDLGAPPITGSPMLDRYRDARLVNLTGDFNGDGFRDLAARTAPEEIVVYLARGWDGFATKPAVRIPIPEGGDFAVADLNGDGLADLLLSWPAPDAAGGPTQTIAYITKGGAA